MKYLGHELNRFPNQIRYAVDNYRLHQIKISDIQNIIICGLGGSGIAGKIAKNYFFDKLPLPVDTVSDYILPSYVNKNTLAILSSYSGTTEETLAMYHIAKEKGCKIIVITTGGDLGALAAQNGDIVYITETGFQPRMALGYSLTTLCQIFFELIGVEKKADLLKIADFVSNEDDFVRNSGLIVDKFENTIHQNYVIVCDPYFEGVAIRLTQQIQENAKLQAFVTVVPEANHNVIETYHHQHNTNYIFLNSKKNLRTNLRFSFLKEILTKQNSIVHEYDLMDNNLAYVYHTIYQLDWLSLQLADRAGAISNTVPIIMDLKKYLSEN